MKKNKLIIPIFITIVFAVTILLLLNQNNRDERLNSNEVKQLIHEYSSGQRTAASASISSDTLTVKTLENKELIYRLPKDEFFVSFAPYLVETHPCAIHNLAGCRGELADKEFSVLVKDKAGRIYVDESLKSQPNGFIDLWLPRNNDYQMTISYHDKETKINFTTYKDDNTCITALPLT